MKALRAALVAIVAAGGCVTAQAPAEVVRSVDWYDRGVWLKADFHTHSRFSDGTHTVDELVAAASKNGCDVIAINDHADKNLTAGTPEYVAAIVNARERFPQTTVITGMEWNVPPGKGGEHATVLFPTALENVETLAAFKLFDDLDKKGENPELALRGLATLNEGSTELPPVMFFNHPNREPRSTSHPSLTFVALQQAAKGVLIGFEGAPGHQRGVPPGGPLTNRWDPLGATVGGVWDQWLQQGLDVWAAIANSDFHQEGGDFWPCEFAATWVYAPDRTPDGVIRALHAGSFFAEHGHIAAEADLQVRIAGVAHVLRAGEVAATSRGVQATVSMTLKTPATDYLGQPNAIDSVELIGISKTGSQVLFEGPPGTVEAFSVAVPVPSGGIVVRARGRRESADGKGLMFYTNPIRLTSP